MCKTTGELQCQLMQIDTITQTQLCLQMQKGRSELAGAKARGRTAGETDPCSDPQLPILFPTRAEFKEDTKPHLCASTCTQARTHAVGSHLSTHRHLWGCGSDLLELSSWLWWHLLGEDFPGCADGCAWQGGEMRAAPGWESSEGLQRTSMAVPEPAHGSGERRRQLHRTLTLPPPILPCPVHPHTPGHGKDTGLPRETLHRRAQGRGHPGIIT